jgi:mono/diheme cytochrome c family protein
MRRPGSADGALLVAAAALALWCGCARTPAARDQKSAATSFAAVTHADGRSPLETSLATGAALYARDCAICHGDTGGGDGFNAYNLSETFGVSPTAFTDPQRMASIKDEELAAAIRGGGPAVGKSPAMPEWGQTLTAGEIADVCQYLRSLPRADANP